MSKKVVGEMDLTEHDASLAEKTGSLAALDAWQTAIVPLNNAVFDKGLAAANYTTQAGNPTLGTELADAIAAWAAVLATFPGVPDLSDLTINEGGGGGFTPFALSHRRRITKKVRARQ